jgi:hypothetical protein
LRNRLISTLSPGSQPKPRFLLSFGGEHLPRLGSALLSADTRALAVAGGGRDAAGGDVELELERRRLDRCVAFLPTT